MNSRVKLQLEDMRSNCVCASHIDSYKATIRSVFNNLQAGEYNLEDIFCIFTVIEYLREHSIAYTDITHAQINDKLLNIMVVGATEDQQRCLNCSHKACLHQWNTTANGNVYSICNSQYDCDCTIYIRTPLKYKHKWNGNNWNILDASGNYEIILACGCKLNSTEYFQTCAYCNKCMNHCSCPKCPRCSRTVRGVLCLTNCERHEIECCGCCCVDDPLQYVEFYNRRVQFIGNSVPPNRLASVEIEVCGTRMSPKENNDRIKQLDHVLYTWGCSVVSDGSLPSDGFEINTSPTSGKYTTDMVNAVTDALENCGAWVNEKAGLHCHVDTRDFRFNHIRRLIYVFNKIEKTLYLMNPVTRYISNYCIPSGKFYLDSITGANTPGKTKSQIIKSVYRDELHMTENKGKKYYHGSGEPGKNGRYSSLNLHSYFFRGTIECRIHKGTVNRDEILNWMNLWQGLVNYVKVTPFKQIRDLIKSNNSVDTLKKIIPPDLSAYIDNQMLKYKQEHILNGGIKECAD